MGIETQAHDSICNKRWLNIENRCIVTPLINTSCHGSLSKDVKENFKVKNRNIHSASRGLELMRATMYQMYGAQFAGNIKTEIYRICCYR